MEQYNKFIASIEIVDLFLEEMSFKRHRFPDSKKYPELSVNISSKECTYTQDKQTIHIKQRVEFNIETSEQDSRKKVKIFELNADFCVIYNTKEKMTEEIFSIFKSSNIPVNIHPYLREIIHNAMNRAGLPPVVIPVLKIKR